ncbi:MAG: hypothetical protein MJE68_25155 [Proteobacteria bacterium]|nr:hypothetical protein [Pseudomonadota bacterium]
MNYSRVEIVKNVLEREPEKEGGRREIERGNREREKEKRQGEGMVGGIMNGEEHLMSNVILFVQLLN